MIKFIDKDGNIFEGQLPYIHWLEGGQSVGLWYDLKLLVITDNSNTLLPLVCNGLNENSIFKFVRRDALEDIEFNIEPIDISDNSSVLTTFYNDFTCLSKKKKKCKAFNYTLHFLSFIYSFYLLI